MIWNFLLEVFTTWLTLRWDEIAKPTEMRWNWSKVLERRGDWLWQSTIASACLLTNLKVDAAWAWVAGMIWSWWNNDILFGSGLAVFIGVIGVILAVVFWCSDLPVPKQSFSRVIFLWFMKDDITVSELDIIVNIPAITAYICIQLVFTTAYSEGWKSLFNGMILILIKFLSAQGKRGGEWGPKM